MSVFEVLYTEKTHSGTIAVVRVNWRKLFAFIYTAVIGFEAGLILDLVKQLKR